jgi:Type IV secretory pathway, VirB11 components, and related ATPases involved in archaeal flagella biosynthesis
MSTGHTTYTTFHADSVGEVLKRFTTDPINVSKTMFTALDLVSIQTSTRVQGRKVRRNKSLTEINHYDAENDEINVQDVFQWQAETDEFLRMGDSSVLEEIMFDRGWSRERLDDELRKRRVVLAYLIDRELNSYAQVAATFQAFINDPETVLALMANDGLERSLEDLREMESVLIDVDREKEELVPRPDPDEAGREEAAAILDEAADLFATYRGSVPDSVAGALLEVDAARDVEASPADDHDTLATISEVAAEREAGVVGPTRSDDEGPDDRGSATEAGADLPTDNGAAASLANGGSDRDPGPAEDDRENGASDGIDFDDAFDDGVDVGRSATDGAGGDADATDSPDEADAADDNIPGPSEEEA